MIQDTNEDNARKFYQDAQALIRDGQHEEAMNILLELLESQHYAAAAHNDLGVLYGTVGNKEKELSHFEMAVKIDPGNMDFKRNLGNFFLRQPNGIEKAMRIYLEILGADPKDLQTLLTLGQVCMLLNKPNDAKIFFEKAAEVEPWNLDACEGLENINKIRLEEELTSERDKSGIAAFQKKGGLDGAFRNNYSAWESNDEVHKILNLLKENTPFAYSRFNDGEMIAIVNRSGIIARGAQQITPQLADKLTMSLLYEQENYWKGLICKSCFPDLHPMAMKLVGNYPYLTSAVALVNRNWRTFLIECRQHLQDRKIIWIGGEDQNTDNLNTFLGISISKTYRYCNQNTWDLYDQIKMLIGEFEPGKCGFHKFGAGIKDIGSGMVCHYAANNFY